MPDESSSTKTFRGHPNDDNPQTQNRETNFRRQARKDELEICASENLASMLGDHMSGEFGVALRAKDFDKYMDLRYYALGGGYHLSPHEKEKTIEAILDAEFPEPTTSRTIPTETASEETLVTDEISLSKLTDTALVNHVKKLVQNKDFKRTAVPSRFDELVELARTTEVDGWGQLYKWEREALTTAITNAAAKQKDSSFSSRRGF